MESMRKWRRKCTDIFNNFKQNCFLSNDCTSEGTKSTHMDKAYSNSQ